MTPAATRARSLLSPFPRSARENDPRERTGERMNIEGSVAVVTGGASGLGEATAQRLADGGGRPAYRDSAPSKSASRSFQCSVPIETRTRPGVMPACASSAPESSLWVVVIGWHARVSTPPRLTAL